jgi:hypothetical protein
VSLINQNFETKLGHAQLDHWAKVIEVILEKTEKGGEASFTLEDLRPAKDE